MKSWKQLIAIAAAICWLSLGDASLNMVVGQDGVPARFYHVQPAPTIILKPATPGASSSGNCVVEVKPIGDSAGNEFSVKISVPDSVTEIEIQPDHSSGARRNFRIQLDQPSQPNQPSQPVVSRPRSDIPIVFGSTDRAIGMFVRSSDNSAATSTPTRTPSSVPVRNAAGPLKPMVLQHRPRPVPISIPIEQAGKMGFQANPYFESTVGESVVKEKLSDQSLNPFPVDPSSGPILASFPLPAKDAFTDRPLTAQQIPTIEQHDVARLSLPRPIQTAIYGPTALGLGAIGDYVIEVANSTTEPSSEITLQLDVPEGLDVVMLGREATIDGEQNRVTWNLPAIAGNGKTLVRYRVKTVAEGHQRQTIGVTWGASGDSQVDCEFETKVLVEFETLSAPKLDFESE